MAGSAVNQILLQMFEKEKRDCYRKAMRKHLVEAEYNHIRELIHSKEETGDLYINHLRDLSAKTAKLRKHKITSEHYFVSVSPDPKHSVYDLVTKVEKYVNRKMIAGSMYTYEWNKSGNPHVHLLIHNLENSDSDFRKNTKNTFKSLVGNLACVDIKRVPDDWVEDKKLYILGQKWDEAKNDMVILDKTYRSEHDLKDVYYTGTMSKEEPLLDEGSSDISYN